MVRITKTTDKNKNLTKTTDKTRYSGTVRISLKHQKKTGTLEQ